MGTYLSGGNIFCVFLQINDLLQKFDRRLRSSEAKFRKHNVLSAAYTLPAAFHNLTVSFFHCSILHCLGRWDILISIQFLMIEVGSLIVFELILHIVPFLRT